MRLLSGAPDLPVPTCEEKQGHQAGILEPHLLAWEPGEAPKVLNDPGPPEEPCLFETPWQHLGVVSKTKEGSVRSETVAKLG